MALGPTYYPSYIPAHGNYVRHNAQHIQRNEQPQRSETRQSPPNEQALPSTSYTSTRASAPQSILRTGADTNTASHVAAGSEHRYYHNTLGYMYRPRPVPATSANAIQAAVSLPQREVHDDNVSLQGTSSSAGSYHAGSPTTSTADVSRRYPDLHFMVASDSTRILYDVRLPPTQGIESNLYEAYRHLWTSREPVKHMRLISRDFPWTFDIRIAPPPTEASVASPRSGGSGGSTGSISPTTGFRRRARFDIPEAEEEPDEKGVQLGHIWDVLYNYLYEPVQAAEWAAMVQMLEPAEARTWRRAIEEFAERRRVQEGSNQLVIRRIDWLGRRCVFRGIGKDDEFAKLMLLPGEEECAETWVVKFTNASH
ncbi:hypothetical protein SCHPADRAFT_901096 [Schizopora paradoxa]|uniref:DUF6699 domain-containing protein n=1 Tax=Schizopora paradoxa TaxID=27342 RepID=A0A0H2RYZ8_9AGAM|nr:hypothetical protein SCHPADRAFT_901096 [Schizopora paradoxa]